MAQDSREPTNFGHKFLAHRINNPKQSLPLANVIHFTSSSKFLIFIEKQNEDSHLINWLKGIIG